MNVLLIDDHALFREGVALLLRPLVADLSPWEAGSCEEGLALLELQGAADLVLIDLGLPGMSGLQGILALRERYPDTPVVALSSSDDKDTVLQALDAGAMGFIPKSSTSSVFVGALKLIMAKGIYLPPSVFLPTQRLFAEHVALQSVGATDSMSVRRPEDLGLTPRQTEVLYLILQGKAAKLISRELDLSVSTVKAHTSAVLRALNVTTRTQAVVAAGRLGLRF
ncbi:response regulator transcription factor [soil metagenome]